jgi:hypothetical protein
LNEFGRRRGQPFDTSSFGYRHCYFKTVAATRAGRPGGRVSGTAA